MARKRPDGDGLVRKRKDGRWEGRIVIGHKEDGTPIYKSVFAKTQKELMPKLHGAIDCYRDADLSEQGNMTLSDWIEQWLTSYAEPTLREYRLRVSQRRASSHQACAGQQEAALHYATGCAKVL